MRIVVGVGLSSEATADEVRGLVEAALAEAGLRLADVTAVATRHHLADDPRLTILGPPVEGLGDGELGRTAARPRVAEPAALAVAGPGARLVVGKRTSAHATCAVATC